MAALVGGASAQAAVGAPVRPDYLLTIALAVSGISLLIAMMAFGNARRARKELRQQMRSMEMAVRDLSSRRDRDTASISEINRKISDEIARISEIAAAEPEPARAETPAPIVREARPMLSVVTADARQDSGTFNTDAESALAAAVAADEMEISLQPIISVAQSAAVGFEAHAHIDLGGRTLDVRRLAQPVPGLETAAFEAALARAAIAAGRRQLGSASERMPFHVAISDALLSTPRQLDGIVDMARVHRGLLSSIVFSVPYTALMPGTEARAGIEKLSATGFRIAAEGWEGTQADAAQIHGAGVQMVKIGVNRLLDRERVRRNAPAGSDLMEAATLAGITVIATGVVRDEDAVGLLDLGVDQMLGERFSEPKRLRSAAARQMAVAQG